MGAGSTHMTEHSRKVLLSFKVASALQEIDSRMVIGGPGRDRTDDLFHAMEARSQLRHRPIRRENSNLIFAYVRGIVKPGTQILCIR